MTKIILALLLAISILFPSASAFAQETDNTYSNAVYNKMEDAIKTYISQTPNLKNPEDFPVIFECCDRAKYENVSAYISFIYENRFTPSQLQVINRILESGTTIQSLMQVYDFWLTTDEDFEMIEEICALENVYFSEYWFESAFNKLTEYKHGELNGEDIIHYQNAGLTTDQILAANVMCRKNGKNIFSILESHLMGNTLENQAKALYGVDSLPTEGSLFNRVSSLAKDTKRNNMFFSIESKSGQNDVLIELVKNKINREISRLKIDNKETNAIEDYQTLCNTKYPLSVQKSLINKGYTPQEIAKSWEISGNNLFQSAKLAREMMKNEK